MNFVSYFLVYKIIIKENSKIFIFILNMVMRKFKRLRRKLLSEFK